MTKLYTKLINKCAMCPNFRSIGLGGRNSLCAEINEITCNPSTEYFDPYVEVYEDCPLNDIHTDWCKDDK